MSRYQLLPPLSDDEFEALKADIAANGVLVPVEVDEAGDVLDGHHRLRAADELGIPREEVPTVVRAGMTDEQKLEHAATLNLARRHLTTEQQVEVVATLRRQGMSIRRIAKLSGVPRSTVQRYLRAVPDGTPDEVVGEDGKTYAASWPRAPRGTPAEANGDQALAFHGTLTDQLRPLRQLACTVKTDTPTAAQLRALPEVADDGEPWPDGWREDPDGTALALLTMRGEAAKSLREAEALGDTIASWTPDEFERQAALWEHVSSMEAGALRVLTAWWAQEGDVDDGALRALRSLIPPDAPDEQPLDHLGRLSLAQPFDGEDYPIRRAYELLRLDAKFRRLTPAQALAAFGEVARRHPDGDRDDVDFDAALAEVLDDAEFVRQLTEEDGQ